MNNFLEAFSVSQVSKKIDVPVGTLYQWETDFKDVFKIDRNENNERIYTELEIDVFRNIKAMREKNVSKAIIRGLLEKNQSADEVMKRVQPTLPQLRQSEAIEALRDIQSMPEMIEKLFESKMDEMKEEIKKEVREEIRKELKNEKSNATEEIARRDKLLIENTKLLQEMRKEKEENAISLKELKKEKEKSFFSRLFSK